MILDLKPEDDGADSEDLNIRDDDAVATGAFPSESFVVDGSGSEETTPLELFAFVTPIAVGWLSLATVTASPPPYEAPIYDYRDGLATPRRTSADALLTASGPLGATASIEDGDDIPIQTFALARSGAYASFVPSLRPSESTTRYFDAVRGGAVNPAMVAAFLGTAPSLERAPLPVASNVAKSSGPSRRLIPVSYRLKRLFRRLFSSSG